MRRIARLSHASGVRLASPARPRVPFPSQCAAAASPARSTAALRCYSSKQPSDPLPGSLADRPADALSTEELPVELTGEQHHQPASYVPPPARSEAERADLVSDPEYLPANTAEGLRSVGDLGRWWETRDHWPRECDFVGFKAKKKVEHPVLLEVAVRRAVTEALALKQQDMGSQLTGFWSLEDQAQYESVLGLQVQVDEAGDAKVRGTDAKPPAHVVAVEEKGKAPMRYTAEPAFILPSVAEALAWKETADPAWKKVSLQDPRVKFAVTKRILQLTGQLIPDYKLADITDAGALLAALVRAPKPATFSDEIQAKKQSLINLPNVSFAPKRVTRGDKDKALGRYKLIEEEFAKRDLQGGPLSVHKSKEKSWFKGGV